MTTLLLIRHAITDSVGKSLAGRKKAIPLNDHGRQQAQKLAQHISHLPIHAIYASPLERTTETANYIAEKIHQEVILSEDFLEINFGEWTNNTFDNLAGHKQFRLFNQFRSHTRIPGGETMFEAQARIVSGIQKICILHDGQTVAVVSHSDLIKAAIAFYAGIPLDLMQRIEISPASATVIELYAEMPLIKLVNYTGEIKL